MKVVSDTSPLCYSVLLGRPDLLGDVFENVRVPAAVIAELLDAKAPDAVRKWAQRPPAWLAADLDESASEPRGDDDPLLTRLHEGERAAILLAQLIGADLLLVDERAARRAATQKGIKVAGLLAVVRLAADRGLLDFSSAVQALHKAGFRMSPELIKRLH